MSRHRLAFMMGLSNGCLNLFKIKLNIIWGLAVSKYPTGNHHLDIIDAHFKGLANTLNDRIHTIDFVAAIRTYKDAAGSVTTERKHLAGS